MSRSGGFDCVLAVNVGADLVAAVCQHQCGLLTGVVCGGTFKRARWALLKRPEHLSDTQAGQLAEIKRAGSAVPRPRGAGTAGDLTLISPQ